MEFLWEMFSALVLHFTKHAALWSVKGPTVLSIYTGLNLEIALMFGVAPLVLVRLLPKAHGRRRRYAVPVLLAGFFLAVEVILNRAGVLVWTWWFWRWPHVELIFLSYLLPFVVLVFVYGRVPLRWKIRGAGARVGLAFSAPLLLAVALRRI